MVIGRVSWINKRLVCVDLDNDLGMDETCWFQPYGDYPIEVGDIISGNLSSSGETELQNTTKGYRMRVFIRDSL